MNCKKRIAIIRKDEPKVSFSEIETALKTKGLKQSSIKMYLNAVRRANNVIVGRESDYFYWRFFSQKSSLDTIVADNITNYKIKNANSLVSKLTPIKKVLEMVPDLPAQTLVLLNQYIQDIKEHFVQFMEKYTNAVREKDIQTRNRKSKEELTLPWNVLLAELSSCFDNATDSRFKVLALVYQNGFVLRPCELINTTIIDDGKSNYLDLENQSWLIRKTKTFQRQFPVPGKLCNEIKEIIASNDIFKGGFLLPKRDGSCYGTSDGFFKTWTSCGMQSAYTYRHSYLSWFAKRPDTTQEQFENLTRILGHKITTATTHYIS